MCPLWVAVSQLIKAHILQPSSKKKTNKKMNTHKNRGISFFFSMPVFFFSLPVNVSALASVLQPLVKFVVDNTMERDTDPHCALDHLKMVWSTHYVAALRLLCIKSHTVWTMLTSICIITESSFLISFGISKATLLLSSVDLACRSCQKYSIYCIWTQKK